MSQTRLSRQFAGTASTQTPKKRAVITTQYGSARVGPKGYVSNVVVDYSHRGEGHGHELMDQVTSHADEIGLPLTLNAREELHPFYRKHGFEPTNNPSPFGPEMKRAPR